MIIEFSDETESEIFGGTLRNLLLVFLSKQAEEFPNQYDALLSAAEELEGRVQPVLIDADMEDHARILNFFSLESVNIPAVRLVLFNSDDLDRYAMDEPFTREHYLSFVNAWEAGELLPLPISSEIPETQDENGVYVVVGNSFEDQVRNAGKNVFVHIHASWSGHSKELLPTWARLAERYADVDDVRIARMDGTLNKVRDLYVPEFPTLIYFLASGGVKYYHGDRTFEDLVQFVESGRTHD